MRRFVFFLLMLPALACGQYVTLTPSPVAPTPAATQTPLVRLVTTTPEPTRTPVVVQITTTPKPTSEIRFCVSADEAVYLRPSPGMDNYPITELENGREVVSLGGRNRNWVFVEYGDKRGWVNEKFLQPCQ